jgi:DNA-binding response OmpR family regulator
LLARLVLLAPENARKAQNARRRRRFARAGRPSTDASTARFVAASRVRRCAVKVLLLEDDQRLARFLTRVLCEEGLAVDVCGRGTDAIAQADGGLYDLIVLDWMVPETDGLTVCREIRRAGGVAPILMLTARGETRERVMGLEAGADDYMVKPFEVDEFLARVRAQLRRSSGFAGLRCGELEVDRITRQARLAGADLTLTQREYALLLHLLRRANQIVKRSDLLAGVWGVRFDTSSNIVDVHVSRLRDRLGDRSWMIETVRGVGYRLRRQPPAP